ncbi:unnamed protein product [Fusarium equiseti]|uniref:Uncharacterized protein n=1 Tax=Fusarium equiseti TaxID=61235 RepID=A0A8J2IPI6_FUSEQ|nr:unnamed protein product [Fusarium equiseti]
MSQLNADSIITLVSAIPALRIASLSAQLAYLTLRRRNISRNDVERSMIELLSDIKPTPSRTPLEPLPSYPSITIVSSSKNLPQFPPLALLGDFERQTRFLPITLSDGRYQPANHQMGGDGPHFASTCRLLSLVL